MHVDADKLVTVANPLEVTWSNRINLYPYFKPKLVYFDPKSAFHSITTMFPAVVSDVGGARDYMS